MCKTCGNLLLCYCLTTLRNRNYCLFSVSDLSALPESPFFSVPELAAVLNVKQSTLYYWKAEGKGPSSIRVGKHLRYRRSDVEEWLNALETSA